MIQLVLKEKKYNDPIEIRLEEICFTEWGWGTGRARM